MSVIVDAVGFAVDLVRNMPAKERSQFFERIKDLMPESTKADGLCIDGKEHKFKAIRSTDYLFSFLNKTQVMCQKCGVQKWL